MHTPRRAVGLFFGLLLLARSAGAIDPADAARQIQPLLDSQDVLVIHFDPARYELKGLEDWWADLVQRVVPPPQRDVVLKQLRNAMQQMREWMGEIQKAGAKQVFVLVRADGGPPALVFPLEPGANAEQLQKVLRAGPQKREPTADQPPFTTSVKNAVLMADSKNVLTRVEKAKGEARIDLQPALAAVADAPLQVALLPAPEARQSLEQQLRKMALLPAVNPAAVIGNIRWAALGAGDKDGMSLRLIVQAPDGRAAQSIEDAISRALDALQKQVPAAAKAVPMLTPRVQGTQLVLELNARQVRSLSENVVAPVMVLQQQIAMRSASANVIRALVARGRQYAESHNGAWPDTIEALAGDQKWLLLDPRSPERRVGFVYVKPKAQPGAQTVVIYEAYDNWGEGINVGFGDGHVEWVKDEAKFRKQLEE